MFTTASVPMPSTPNPGGSPLSSHPPRLGPHGYHLLSSLWKMSTPSPEQSSQPGLQMCLIILKVKTEVWEAITLKDCIQDRIMTN